MLVLLAFLVAVLGAGPLLITRRNWSPAILAVAYFVAALLILYLARPSTAPPLWGTFGFLVMMGWIGAAAVDGILEEKPTVLGLLPLAGILAFGGRACSGCAAFRASDYAKMIGPLEERDWSKDVQPADPAHVRLVPPELAHWLGNKQLGEAPGAIGSRFKIEKDSLTLQRIKGELWYVAPLEFQGWRAWHSAGHSPGYVMIHGEDPERKPIVKTDERFVYTPGAYWSDNLERHLQSAGYRDVGLADFSLEIDEEGKAWWVVTAYEYTIGWGGEKPTGVVVVDPSTGDTVFHPVGKIPAWIDRVYPKSFVKTYIEDWGKYWDGWTNSWWGHKDIKQPEEPSLVYGSDGDPYWVTGITSNSGADEALIGLIYTDVRTGVSTFYRASGGTDTAILQAVDNKVAYKRQHGASPVIYNINGSMASVVPLLGENHTQQGVAIVDVARPQDVAIADDLQQALREYKRLMSRRGVSDSIAASDAIVKVAGKVERFAAETRNGDTSYVLTVS
ncbi:MAG TPA: hypothetical protein VJ694_03040, partial [Patescibacteria group bacterium]|nr:hypothetical protein [Patescibacteria group bacterium]